MKIIGKEEALHNTACALAEERARLTARILVSLINGMGETPCETKLLVERAHDIADHHMFTLYASNNDVAYSMAEFVLSDDVVDDDE